MPSPRTQASPRTAQGRTGSRSTQRPGRSPTRTGSRGRPVCSKSLSGGPAATAWSGGFGQDQAVAAGPFRDVAVPAGRQPRGAQPFQVAGGTGVIPEHLGAQEWLGAGPPPGAHNGQEIAARPQPSPDAREQRPLIRERQV